MPKTDHLKKRSAGRPEDTEKTKAILKRTGEIVANQGVAALTMEGVARAAGVSKATIYKKFGSKEKLLSAYVAHHTAGLEHASPPALDTLNGPETLNRFGVWLLTLVTRKDVLRFDNAVAAAAPRYPKIAQRVYEAGPKRAVTMLAEVLERASSEGLYLSADPLEEAETLIGLWASGLYDAARMTGTCAWPRAKIERHIARKTELFLRAYR